VRRRKSKTLANSDDDEPRLLSTLSAINRTPEPPKPKLSKSKAGRIRLATLDALNTGLSISPQRSSGDHNVSRPTRTRSRVRLATEVESLSFGGTRRNTRTFFGPKVIPEPREDDTNTITPETEVSDSADEVRESLSASAKRQPRRRSNSQEAGVPESDDEGIDTPVSITRLRRRRTNKRRVSDDDGGQADDDSSQRHAGSPTRVCDPAMDEHAEDMFNEPVARKSKGKRKALPDAALAVDNLLQLDNKRKLGVKSKPDSNDHSTRTKVKSKGISKSDPEENYPEQPPSPIRKSRRRKIADLALETELVQPKVSQTKAGRKKQPSIAPAAASTQAHTASHDVLLDRPNGPMQEAKRSRKRKILASVAPESEEIQSAAHVKRRRVKQAALVKDTNNASEGEPPLHQSGLKA
jgi:hypothetical protein